MQPESLYEIVTDDVHLDAPVLVHALSGFLDAGGARQIAVAHLLATHGHRTVAEFDIDAIYDYRARRPRLVFDTDHYASIDYPELLLTEGSWANLGDAPCSSSFPWMPMFTTSTGYLRAVSRALQSRGYIEEIVSTYTVPGNVAQGGGIDQ